MELYHSIIRFFELGGDVLYLIAITTLLMWSLIIERIYYFIAEHRNVIRVATETWEARDERRSWTARVIREALVSEASTRIRGSMPIILTCITLCPLLGLLGTVTGMIQVFDAMATQGGNARSMAAGVSAATIPTMSGMIASLSGILGSLLIRRRIDRESELLDEHLTMDH
ncbi:MAG: MotA/TolQ/ExbB proton channel family protein [Gammaproteobacteria bacterium]|nr:MotA/TolQ/ExbB proton channel family protein [Gammaproteobacteria bacterium]